MPWQQLIIEAPPETASDLAEWLEEQGASAVTLEDAADQPLYEPEPGTTPLWQQTRMVALFPEEEDVDALAARLQAEREEAGAINWQVAHLEDDDWERAWMDRFEPMRFGERLWVVPGWLEAPEPEAVNIVLDPGLAFGTGTHATTALCLEWLDGRDLHGQEVIDYGCGSGVLAVASVLLGAEEVWATDIEEQALTATMANAEKNGVANHIQTLPPDALPEITVDLMLANILAGPLVELAAGLAERVRPGGHIVLSGILEEQAEQVRAAYSPWFEIGPPTVKDGWVRLDGPRKPDGVDG